VLLLGRENRKRETFVRCVLLIRYPINAPACDVKGYAGISSIEFVFNQQKILFFFGCYSSGRKPLQSSLIGCCCHRYASLSSASSFSIFRSIITNQKIDINSSSSWGGWSYNSQLLISDTGAAMFDVDAKEMKEKGKNNNFGRSCYYTLRAPG
jgi:hypothetical protein